MKATQAVLNKILDNCRHIEAGLVKRVLILYEEAEFFIGDNCLRFDQMKSCKPFFKGAMLDINFNNKRFAERYQALVQNNPNIDHATYLAWKEIDFAAYDVIICITYEEEALIKHLQAEYGDALLSGQWNAAIFSATLHYMKPLANCDIIFPSYDDLMDYAVSTAGLEPVELYLTADEREWGNQWLRDKGLKEDELLFIMLDSTSRKKKLLRTSVYFNILSYLLEQDKVKVLIFDEKNIGKEAFYRHWLGDEKAERLIFSRSLKLREDFCLLGSAYTKMIFGPCTGLMHCASSIYNNFIRNGMSRADAPLMVTYTGKYWRLDQIWDACITAYYWWGNSPLVDCLIIRKDAEQAEMVELRNLNEEERNATDNLLFCDAYTDTMLIGYLSSKLNPTSTVLMDAVA